MATGSIMTNEEQELVLTREFDAPRELVFKVWIDPKHVAQWWGPRGFTNPCASWTQSPVAPSAFTCADLTASSIR